MKIKDIEKLLEEKQLFEVKMSPSSLKQMASQIQGALVGIEFEMGVPNLGGEENDPEPDYDVEKDIDMDSPYTFRQSVLEFFSSDGHNTGTLINNEVDKFLEEWEEWKKETIADLEIEDEESEELSLGNYCDHRHIYDMQDFYHTCMLVWPYYYDTFAGNQGEYAIEEVADAFSEHMGVRVNYSTEYHQAEREEGAWALEPDSSINVEGSYGGLEFISPPLPAEEIQYHVQAVYDFAKTNGCITNNSTGLHINVSVPNYSAFNMDFVKLTLLLGDKYILEKFGRSAVHFCASAFDKIDANIAAMSWNKLPMDTVINDMKKGLNLEAGKLIHSGDTRKYTSINVKPEWVEFRSPGGDYLKRDPSEIVNTILRFVVALDAACDPEKYKRDYQKKLVKLMSQYMSDDNDKHNLDLFSRFVSGDIDLEQMNKFILARAKLKKYDASREMSDTKPVFVWRVAIRDNDSIHGVHTTVIRAETKEKALQMARKEFAEYFGDDILTMPDSDMRITYLGEA